LARRAAKAGYHVVEVPITSVERELGDSRVSRDILVEALWRVTAWGVGGRGGKGPGRTGPRAAGGGPGTAARAAQGLPPPAAARSGESSPGQEHGGGRRDATPQDT